MRKIHLSVVASVFLLCCVSSSAQVIFPGPIPEPPFQRVKAYLELTDAQVSQIVLNLNDYARLVGQRQQRMFQVQSEIHDETAKSPLDPAALGIRYAEVETLCRNVRDEGIAAQNRNLGTLTDAQRAKLKLLDDIYKMLPIISEAQSAGLFTPPAPNSPFGLQLFNTTGFISPVLLNGCQQPGLPTLSLRSGDFSGTP